MKLTMKLWILVFGILMFTTVIYAESPREQLKQMVEQLQKNPTDNALHKPLLSLGIITPSFSRLRPACRR